MINLRQFLQALRENGEVVDIEHPVDPHLEIAEIHRRVAQENGPALFFHNVKGSTFPVVTNLFGSKRRVEMAFGHRPDKSIARLIELFTREFPFKFKKAWGERTHFKTLGNLGTKKGKRGPVTQVSMDPVDLEKLPLLQLWPEDGGHFVTLPLVYTQHPTDGTPNLGMYRIQRFDKTRTGLHFQIQKGGGFHYAQAENLLQTLPVHIFIGGPPALIMSAITPLPENVSELLLAGYLQGKKLAVSEEPNGYPLISECEFALVGHSKPHVRHPEGPFGDHYGYYSLEHDFPLFECEKIYHRKDAIYPATVVGKPRQEDFYIGDYLQELLSPLFPVVMPTVRDLWSYGETGFHSLSAAVVKERFYRESMTAAFRILGEGQLSLTKFLLVTDQPVNLRNFPKTLTTILERFQPETDLFIFANLSMDTLDYTGPKLNEGSRGVMLGVGEKVRDLPTEAPPGTRAYCPGCLITDSPRAHFPEWPLIIVVDDIEATCKDDMSFLWTVFTRFEPAADIHAQKKIVRNQISYSGSITIDARMKQNYPQEVQVDPETERLVSNNWLHYFKSL